MLVWVNGSSGAGKTTIARLIVNQDQDWRAFDPECVGIMLRALLRASAGRTPPGGM